MGSPKKLLCIVVPTYNRAAHLRFLLENLVEELVGLDHLVEIIVSDNASTDSTQDVTLAFKEACPSAIIVRQPENVGSDENFCRGIESANSRFVWLMGDDDSPKKGVLAGITGLLLERDPDLVYLPSEWRPCISAGRSGVALPPLSSVCVSRKVFAAAVNVWLTFISGLVFKIEHLRSPSSPIRLRQFSGTSLVQLGWILPILGAGVKFEVVSQRCVLATSDNSGGYSLMRVFHTNFLAILDACDSVTPEIRQAITHRLIWCFLPSQIWSQRFRGLGRFGREVDLSELRSANQTLSYWVMLHPVATLPKPLATIFFVASHVYRRGLRLKDFIVHGVVC